MWIYRRFVTSILVCGLLFGCVFFIRQQLSDNKSRTSPPEFFPNVDRFRTSRVCSRRVLVLVNSSPAHAQRRQVIRETWAHPTVTQLLDISVAFGVGAADRADIQRSLDWEAEIYGDIFQDSTLDTTTTSSSAYKVVRLLKAARSACSPLPEFILKTEDDVFVNAYSLGELLESLEMQSSSNTMWCIEWNRKLDKTGNNATWIVLRTLSGNNDHPTYCIGTVYLLTGRALDALILRHEAQTGTILLPEDVYVTGMLTKEARTTLSSLGERFVFDDQSEEMDAGRVAFAKLGDRVENGTPKLWRVLVKEKLNNGSRRSDVGL